MKLMTCLILVYMIITSFALYFNYLSEFTTEVVIYIAGYILNNIKMKLELKNICSIQPLTDSVNDTTELPK